MLTDPVKKEDRIIEDEEVLPGEEPMLDEHYDDPYSHIDDFEYYVEEDENPREYDPRDE